MLPFLLYGSATKLLSAETVEFITAAFPLVELVVLIVVMLCLIWRDRRRSGRW